MKLNRKIDYFIVGPGTEAERVASAETTLKMHEFSDVFTGTGYFKGTSPRSKMM